MNKDDIIRMAGQVDAVTNVLLDRKEPQGMNHETFVWFLERFAQLVLLDHWSKQTTVSDMREQIAAEREACAKVCDSRAFQFRSESPFFAEMLGLADAIRARGKP